MNVAFRTDASSGMGSGHVMRCRALADEVRARGGATRFVCREIPGGIRSLLVEHEHEVVLVSNGAAENARDALTGRIWDWLIVDHYGLDASWEAALRSAATRIGVIDDLANRPHDCDLLVDQNVHRESGMRYRGLVPPHCRLLLGPGFALLREEFRRARPTVGQRRGAVRRVLISFGGSDTAPMTAIAMRAAALAGVTAADVVVSAGNTDLRELQALCESLGFTWHVDTTRMAHLMATADVAIGAGGTTIWERCCMGLPAIVIAIADNQQEVMEDAAHRGLVYAPDTASTVARLGEHIRALMDNTALRALISQAGLATVDGNGVIRVANALDATPIELRQATIHDAELLIEWRNHDSVRLNSRHQQVISAEAHRAWLASTLSDADRFLLIGSQRGDACGAVRFDIDGDEAEVSIYLAPDRAGRGLGRALLAAGERWIAERCPHVARVKAEVLGGNGRSQRLFESNGYHLDVLTYHKQLTA